MCVYVCVCVCVCVCACVQKKIETISNDMWNLLGELALSSYSASQSDLLAGQGDLCVRVPDLVSFVKDDIVPGTAQEQISVQTNTGICRDQDAAAWNGKKEGGGMEGGSSEEWPVARMEERREMNESCPYLKQSCPQAPSCLPRTFQCRAALRHGMGPTRYGTQTPTAA